MDSRAPASTSSKTWDCVDRSSGAVTSVKMQGPGGCSPGCQCPKCSNPEQNATTENAEYFTACGAGAGGLGNEISCGKDDSIAYAIDEFGAPGMEFKDWVTAQAVDPQVMNNHSEFVKDRIKGNPQNILGRTHSPDSHDSYDPIPWVGLRRPEAVKVCNPTQVSDVNYNLYETSPKFTWRSS